MSLTDFINSAIISTYDNDEMNPSMYYFLFKIKKYLANGYVISLSEKDLIRDLTIKILRDKYNDYDLVDFCSYIDDWKKEEYDDSYGGNGCYSFHLLELNTLKYILRKIE